ncbi:MAG: pyruvate formate lyase family protein [Armatimonadota bacterium]
MSASVTPLSSNVVPRLRLSEATHRLAFLGASGHWGRQMIEAGEALPPQPEWSRERHCAEAIRLIAHATPLRIETDELLTGASLYLEAPRHQVPFGGLASISHVTTDYSLGLRLGYDGLRRLIEQRLNSGDDDERARDFWECQLICLDAACHWHERYRQHLRDLIGGSLGAQQEHYQRVLRAGAEVPERPPQTFHEAVQALWLMWEFQRVCGNWTGLGRLDEMLGPYLRRDLADGRLTLDEAREILAHFFIKGTEWRTGQGRGSGDAQNYQNIVLAGVDADGNEVCNEVTYLVLDIIEETRLSEFPVTVRLNSQTPAELYRRTAEVMRLGGGVVAVYNEDIIIRALVKLGLNARTARTFTNDGCWEIIIPGRSSFSYLPFDCMTLLQQTLALDTVGAAAYSSFEDLYADFASRLREAVAQQRQSATVALADPATRDRPSALLCLFMPPCIDRGRGYYHDGPEFHLRSPHAGGLVDAADSLHVIRQIVFEQQELSLEDLVAILRDDWEGHDELRRRVRQSGELYGNDGPADKMMLRLFNDFTDVVEEAAKGTDFLFPAGISTFGRQIAWAPQRLASPHGFRAGEFQSNNLSPAPGTDRHGPTAVLKSYTKLDFDKLPNGGPLEIRLHPTMVKGEEGLQATIALLKTFHALGGFYLSLDVVDAETLRDAQLHPERHLNLSVRIAGWSAHFVSLDEGWQEMIIERTTHGE